MKKLLAIVLAAACAVSMAACAAKTGGDITLPEASMADGQLAAPPEVTSVPYPKDTDFVKDGKVDYSGYDKACDDWQAARQEKLQTMVDPADVAHWFTSSIPVLLQGAGDENRVCSPLNVYMALAMLAAVTDGQTQGQILDALGADSLDELQTRAALLWQENSWNDGLVTSLLANSIWLQDGYEYNEDTLKKLGEEFFASAFSGEMGSEDYNKQLQSWLNDNTGGLLTEQAGSVQLRPETVLALVSTRPVLRGQQHAGDLPRVHGRQDRDVPAQQPVRDSVLRRRVHGDGASAAQQRVDVAFEAGRGRDAGGSAAK